MNSKKAITVLGGGVNEDGSPNARTIPRLESALDLYKKEPSYIITASRATPYKTPPLDPQGFPLDEAYILGGYLLSKGIPHKHLRMERSSFDTLGNAYFIRLLFVEPLGLTDLVVITSAFHMPRARLVFDWVFSLEISSVHVEYIEVPDEKADADVIELRRKKEEKSISLLKENQERHNTWGSVHDWIYNEHTAYLHGGKPMQIDPAVLKTY